MGFFIAACAQAFVGAFYDRRIKSVRHRADDFDLIRDSARIFHDNLIGAVSEIIKLLQHFFRCSEIKRGLIVRVPEALSRHHNASVHRILGIQKVYVAGRRRHFSKLIPERYNMAVDVFYGIQTFHHAVPHKIHIILQRLDFQIIVKGSDFLQALLRFLMQHCVEQLSLRAGAPNDQTLPVRLDFEARHPRPFVIIVQVGIRNQLV